MLKIFLPVREDTWATHFTSQGWDSIQEQIDAGFPYFIQPTGVTGTSTLQYDFGAVVTSNTLITVSYKEVQKAGNTAITMTISTSEDLSSWTTHTAGETRVYASNFRYVKIAISGVPDDSASFAELSDFRVLLSTKEGSITGTATTSAGGSVTVDITGLFIDVTHIAPVAKYNASYGIVCVYDFNDVPNPTEFTIYTYRADTGALVGSVPVSYEIRGVKA